MRAAGRRGSTGSSGQRTASVLARTGDDGFTLIELLVVLLILPVVVGAITLAAITSLNSQTATSARLADSHDAQMTSAYFVRDVQTATQVTTSSSVTQCPVGGQQLLGLSWTVGTTTDYVSYSISNGTAYPYLIRRFCVGGASPSVSYLSTGLFTGLSTVSLSTSCGSGISSCASSGNHMDATVRVTCQNGKNDCATGGWIPTYPSGSAPGISSISITVTEYPSGFRYTLSASPRIETAGSANPPGSEGPALVLLGSGSGVLSCSGSGHNPVDVNGAAAVNSSSAGSLSFGGNDTLTASEVYTQDPTLSGSGGPVTPGAYSGPVVQGPAIPDPFASLPDPSTSGATVYTTTSSLPGPGVYTHAVSLTSAQSIPAGTYIFEQGLSLSGQGSVTGKGVTLFIGIPNASPSTPQPASLSVAGQGYLNVIAPSSGTYQGIAIFQSRYDSNTISLAGLGTSTTLGGVLYAPDAQVSSQGNGAVLAGSIDAMGLGCGGNGGFDIGFSLVSTTPSTQQLALGSSVTDAVEVVAAPNRGGAPVGTVSFYVCGPTGTATSCSSTSNQVGSAVTLTPGAADTSTGTSASFKPTTIGWWCFGAYFTPTDGNSGPSSDTSTGECVDVVGPSIQITFPSDGSSYKQAGSGHGSWTGMDTCTAADICGTASDTSNGTIVDEQVSLEGPGGSCWDGGFSNGVATFTATCDHWVSVTQSGANWLLTWAASDFPATGTYVLKVKVDDSLSLTATATVTFKVT